MTRTLAILSPDIRKQMNPGESQAVTLVLRRIGGDRLIGYHRELEPDNPQETWIKIIPDSLALDPIHPDYALVTLQLTVPPDANLGKHPLKVKFTEDDQSSGSEVEIIIDVQPMEPVLDPWAAWLRRYHWRIILLCIVAAGIAVIITINLR